MTAYLSFHFPELLQFSPMKRFMLEVEDMHNGQQIEETIGI
jgi:hypothetical protein